MVTLQDEYPTFAHTKYSQGKNSKSAKPSDSEAKPQLPPSPRSTTKAPRSSSAEATSSVSPHLRTHPACLTQVLQPSKDIQARAQSQPEAEPEDSESQSSGKGPPEDLPENAPEDEDFESIYLRQVTAEFADDIDQLRQSKDFTEDSVPMLVEAVRLGAEMYSEEERALLMGRRRGEDAGDGEGRGLKY